MKRSKQPEIILASASPRRIEMMGGLGLEFKIIPANIDETIPNGLAPTAIARQLAFLKAKAVANMVQNPEALIIGGDTIVVLGQTILGKPESKKDALKMLTQLSGKTHRVITGLCLIRGKEILRGHVITTVTFRKMPQDWLKAYIATGETMDKAGSYAIQGKGILLVKNIKGDYPNVIGFPLVKFTEMAAQFGLNIFP